MLSVLDLFDVYTPDYRMKCVTNEFATGVIAFV